MIPQLKLKLENLCTYHLKQRKITNCNIIKVYFHIFPPNTSSTSAHIFTHTFITDLLWCEHHIICGVNTVIELASKQIYSHNAEN